MFTLTPARRSDPRPPHAAAPQDLALRVAARAEPDGRIDYGMGFDDGARTTSRCRSTASPC